MKVLVLFAALGVPVLAQAGTVTIKGSDTMVILVQRWAEEFMKKNPDAKIQVTGGGTGTGIAALVNGITDIAAASRPMKEAERAKLGGRAGSAGVEIPVAKDGVAFYVHTANPVRALSVEELRGIYLGDIENWQEVGGRDAPIVLYARESSSGTYVFVKDELLGGDDYAASAQTLPGTAAVIHAVAKEPNGIGFGGAAYGQGVREVRIETAGGEIVLDAASVRSGTYPLARDLFFYTRQKPEGEVKRFVDFVLSPAGQEIVSKVGYFPLR